MAEPPRSRPSADLTSGHTVRRFDAELAKLRGIILEMGEHGVEQAQAAVASLVDGDRSQAFLVLDREPQIDYLALDADEEVFRVIIRRQPAAVDLRIVLALSKIAGDIERAGDEAVRIARQALELEALGDEAAVALDGVLQEALCRLDSKACCMFERSIRAVTSFDVGESLTIFEDEPALYEAFREIRALLCEREQGALTPPQTLCLLTSAHALERIGKHASNIAEQVIYVALGQDIRYRNREILIETLRHRGY